MLKDHTEKEKSFFFLKKTQKEIGTDCRNLREIIKKKMRKMTENKTLEDIFFLETKY